MPAFTFAILILAVMFAAGITLWLLMSGGAAALVAALPAFLIAALALRTLRK